jgi:hypothetical protein
MFIFLLLKVQHIFRLPTWGSKENAQEGFSRRGIPFVLLRFIHLPYYNCVLIWLSTEAITFLLITFQVWRLQAALGEQSEITKSTQQEYERLQNVLSLSLTCPGTFFIEITFSDDMPSFSLLTRSNKYSSFQEKVLCRICYEGEICMVLLPCRHRTLCKYDSTAC